MEKTNNKLEQNKLNELGDEAHDDSSPEVSPGIPEPIQSQELCEINFQGFAFRIGSSQMRADQLAEITLRAYQFLKINGGKDESKVKSYFQ